MTADDVGAKVVVQGYDAVGTLRFFGKHKEKGSLRCGVAYDAPVGKNNGTVGGHWYFECPDSHGVLVSPNKVAIVSLDGTAFDEPPVVSPICAEAEDCLPSLDDAEIAVSKSWTFPSGDGGHPGETSTDVGDSDPSTQQDESHGVVIYASNDEDMAAAGPPSPASPEDDIDTLFFREISDLDANDPASEPALAAEGAETEAEATAGAADGLSEVAEVAILPAGEDELDAIDVDEDPPTPY